MNTRQLITRSTVLFMALSAVFVSNATADDRSTSGVNEQDLISVLHSDASPAEKAIACKKLAIHGTNESVPHLAKLLADPQLSSWARIPLEAIPGEAADKALRDAADSLDGLLLVGTINSIGVRRDVNAVKMLTTHLNNSDAQVAAAAAVALGRIGNDAATQALRQALASSAPANVRAAIAEGCVLCAERLHAAGKSKVAAEVYDEIRTAEVPKQKIIEATRGAILARNKEGIPLLLETFRSPDKKLFQIALSTAREFPGSDVDQALAQELLHTTPDRAALIVQAMADRPDTVVLAAILTAANQGEKRVRLSALDALCRVGDDSCLAPLLEIAVDEDRDLAQAALETLAVLPGIKVDEMIVGMLPSSAGHNHALLLKLIGRRRIDAVANVLPALEHSDSAVRHAALVALGETVSLDTLPELIKQVVASKHPHDAEVAQQALKAASVRMPDRDACAGKLVIAMADAPVETKNVLLETISEVGGTTALKTLGDAAKAVEPQLQDTSTRLLGKWNGAEAAPILLDLAKTAPAEKYRIRALRGYIGLARKFAMTNEDRAQMCQSALEVASRVEEQKLVFDVMKLHPSPATFKLASSAKQDPELKEAAMSATVAIAKKLKEKGIAVEE